ncbi:MAG: hypothetical protein AAGG81_01715 [Chlamydiota bacterium]
MRSSHQRKRTPVTSYHENDSLLLQFILSEFLLVYREVKNLGRHFEELESFTAKKRPKQQRQEALFQLISSLETLSGASHDTMRLFSWGQEDGILHKFNSYAALFSRRSAPEGKNEQYFYRAINQSLLISIQLHDLALTIAELPSSKWKELIEEIGQLEGKIVSNTEKFSKLLFKIIQRFSNDENVIFFLLRHSKEFDELFCPGHVKRLLTKVSQGSLADLEKSLIKKYCKRGFTQLEPIIIEKFESLTNV